MLIVCIIPSTDQLQAEQKLHDQSREEACELNGSILVVIYANPVHSKSAAYQQGCLQA